MENIEIKDDSILISINPKIYNLSIIYSAAYTMMDKAYIILDGNPKEKIIIRLKPKNNQSLEELGNEFHEELLNYAVYKTQSEKNSKIRQTIIQRALLTNGFELEESSAEEAKDDPEGITAPWEKKHEE